MTENYPKDPETRLEGTCPNCQLCVGCKVGDSQPARNVWGETQPAVRCPNPRCGSVVFLNGEKRRV